MLYSGAYFWDHQTASARWGLDLGNVVDAEAQQYENEFVTLIIVPSRPLITLVLNSSTYYICC